MEARDAPQLRGSAEFEEGEGGYGGSFSFRVICGSLAVRIDAASRPITIHRTTITPLGCIYTYTPYSLPLFPSFRPWIVLTITPRLLAPYAPLI